MSTLDFLSGEPAALGKLEVRGDVANLEGAIVLSPTRALLLVEGDPRDARDRLRGQGYRVYDLTAGLADVEVVSERTMRRLTELDLGALPSIGLVARGVTALVERLDGERFRLVVPQELAQYVREVVEDLSQ